jgi:hypothetical protein
VRATERAVGHDTELLTRKLARLAQRARQRFGDMRMTSGLRNTSLTPTARARSVSRAPLCRS